MSQKVPNKKIIVVMPAYHAIKTLSWTLNAIPDGWIDEIILVDDASSDNTAALARSLGLTTIVHQKNVGYGGNQKTCYREALERDADIVVMVHPDFQYDPKYIPEMIQPIADGVTDAVFGSRMLIPGSALDGGMPYWKYVANKGLTWLENLILGLDLSEYHSGFRAYSKNLLSSLPLDANNNNFVFDSEIVVQIALAGFTIHEIPISTRYFKEASMIGFWKSVQYGLMILRLMFDVIAFRLYWKGDARFAARRYQCPACLGGPMILRFHGKKGISDLLSKGYRITEESIGYHFNIYLCHNCRSGYQPLIVRNDALDKVYETQDVDTIYLSEEAGRRKAFRTMLNRLKNFIAVKRLLDIGAGPGLLLSEAKSFGWDAEGIELSQKAVAYGKNMFGVKIHHGSLLKMEEINEDSVDAITAFDFVEHLQKPEDFFKGAWRVVRPGGLVVITTPKFDSFVRKLLGDKWYAILPTHLVYFSRKGLEITAKRHNFEIVLIRHMTRYFSLHYLWYRMHGVLNGVAAPYKEDDQTNSLHFPIQLFDEYEVYLRKKENPAIRRVA